MDESVIDLPDAMERVQDDKELFLELLQIFEDDFVKKRQALAGAISAGDITKIKELAHSIKGASGNISAKVMHAACLQLEQLAKSNSTSGMPDVLKSIDAEFEKIKAYLVQKKKEWERG